MKKLLYPAAILLVLSVAAAYLLVQRRVLPARTAASLLPADTIFLAELPEVARSAVRWRETALHALAQEPEIQAMLEKPRQDLSGLQTLGTRLEAFKAARPRQAFFAVIGLQGEQPRLLMGFRYSGSRSSVEELLAEPRATFQRNNPTGKAELLQEGEVEIQTFTAPPQILAETFRDDWYFASNDLEALKQLLQRYTAPEAGTSTLATEERFRATTKQLAAEPDLTLYLQPELLTERLSGILALTNPAAAKGNVDELRKLRALGFTTQMTGADFHDRWYVLGSTDFAQSPLARRTLTLTSPNTVLYYAGQLNLKSSDVAASPILAQIPQLAPLLEGLQRGGVTLGQLGEALGPEFSLLVDWPSGGPVVSALAAELRHPDTVRKALAGLAQGEPGRSAPWVETQREGAKLYKPANSIMPQFTPVLVVSDTHLLVTLGEEGAGILLKRAAGGESTLATAPVYKSATDALAAPTASFGYLNTSALMQNAYGTVRPMISMALAFNPQAAPYLDAGKLPSPETLARHLGATALSTYAQEGGTLSESKGPVTFSQAAGAGLAMHVAAALPMLQQQIGGTAPAGGLTTPPPAAPPKRISPEAPTAPVTPVPPSASNPAEAPPSLPAPPLPAPSTPVPAVPVAPVP